MLSSAGRRSSVLLQNVADASAHPSGCASRTGLRPEPAKIEFLRCTTAEKGLRRRYRSKGKRPANTTWYSSSDHCLRSAQLVRRLTGDRQDIAESRLVSAPRLLRGTSHLRRFG